MIGPHVSSEWIKQNNFELLVVDKLLDTQRKKQENTKKEQTKEENKWTDNMF